MKRLWLSIALSLVAMVGTVFLVPWLRIGMDIMYVDGRHPGCDLYRSLIGMEFCLKGSMGWVIGLVAMIGFIAILRTAMDVKRERSTGVGHGA